MTRRILVADDSSTIQKVIKIAFSRYATDITEAASYVEILSAVQSGVPDLFIVDASLPGLRGADDLQRLIAQAPGKPLLLLVGTYEAVDEEALRQAGFQHFLRKPFESTELVALADELLGGSLKADASTPPVAAPSPSRAQHATVIHAGGYSALQSQAPHVPPPPMPVVAPTAAPGEFSLSLDLDEASAVAPGGEPRLAPIADIGGLIDLSGEAPAHIPAADAGRKGRRAFEPSQPPAAPDRAFAATVPPPPPTGTPPAANMGRGMSLSLDDDEQTPQLAAPQKGGGSRARSGDASATLLASLEDQLPMLVRQAVEDYCERNFKSLAREVIASELRRLADEKARHLVDN